MPHSPLSDRALGERQLVGEVLLVYSYLLKEEEEENGTHVFYSCLCTIDSCYLYLLYLTAFVVSSEGALYVILPYDYQAAARPLFEHTPVLNNNFEY